MTKKDYELIASVLKARKVTIDRQANHPKLEGFTSEFLKGADFTLEHLAVELAERLGELNPLFNTQRFLKACGVGV